MLLQLAEFHPSSIDFFAERRIRIEDAEPSVEVFGCAPKLFHFEQNGATVPVELVVRTSGRTWYRRFEVEVIVPLGTKVALEQHLRLVLHRSQPDYAQPSTPMAFDAVVLLSPPCYEAERRD